jgi:hypothetical protein
LRSPSRSLLLALLAAASLAMVAALVLVGEGAAVLFSGLGVAFPVLLMALGALRGGRLGAVAPALLALLILLETSTGALFLLRGRILDGPWVFGLPLAVVVQLLGLWLGPLLLVGLAHAFTFDSQGLRQEDLVRLRQRWGGPRG